VYPRAWRSSRGSHLKEKELRRRRIYRSVLTTVLPPTSKASPDAL